MATGGGCPHPRCQAFPLGPLHHASHGPPPRSGEDLWRRFPPLSLTIIRRAEEPLDEKPAIPDSLVASMPPEELRSAMRRLGYRTHNDLAEAIGVSRSSVSLWVQGKVGVPRPVAMLIRMMVGAQRRIY